MMKLDKTKWTRAAAWAGLSLLSLSVTGSTCLVDKTIEVTAGAEITAEFEARGIVNTFDETRTVDVSTDADLRQVLDDNGFEDEVVAYIEGAFVRVIRKDASATDRTVTGSVTVQKGTGGGTELDLIQNRTVAVNDSALATWTPVPLETAGVTLLNQALADYLLDVYVGAPAPRVPVLTFHSSGTSDPQGVRSDFDWEVKVVMTLVGKKDVTVVDPL